MGKKLSAQALAVQGAMAKKIYSCTLLQDIQLHDATMSSGTKKRGLGRFELPISTIFDKDPKVAG
jgi:hypothetical protein